MTPPKNSTATKHQKSLITQQQEATAATRLTRLLHRIAQDEIERYQQSRVFPFPFFVDETFLRKLDSAIRERLALVPSRQSIDFTSETRFQDLSAVRFDEFEAFLQKAGDKKDPERVELTWGKFSLTDQGDVIAGRIEIQFVTEKRLHTQDLAPGEFNYASVRLTASGAHQDWTEQTFLNLVPYIETTKLGGIFKPLWFFRNKWFILALSHVLSWIGFFVGVHFASDLLRGEMRLTRGEVLNKLTADTNIAAKIDMLARELLSPSQSPWWEPIVVIGAGAITFALIFIAGQGLLPKLAPNSSVAIGLANIRARRNLNTFKFIVFTLLVCGLIMPLLVEIVKKLF
jgi:hypothetical protein